MTLQPLLAAPPTTVAHAFAAMAAFVLGIAQFALPKGTVPHRTLGWCWVLLMAWVAVSSFSINTIRQFGPFSFVHVISAFVLVLLPLAVLSARRHEVRRHRRMMLSLFLGGLVVAGAFTFMPGRIMSRVAAGQARGGADIGGVTWR